MTTEEPQQRLYSLRELHEKHLKETGAEYRDAVEHCVEASVTNRVAWLQTMNLIVHGLLALSWLSLYLALTYFTAFGHTKPRLILWLACSYACHCGMLRYVKQRLTATVQQRRVNFGFDESDAFYVALLSRQDVVALVPPRTFTGVTEFYMQSCDEARTALIQNGELPWNTIAFGVQQAVVEYTLHRMLSDHLLGNTGTTTTTTKQKRRKGTVK
jgi:hypothetical protein